MQPRADTALVAASFSQALIGFRHIKAFLFATARTDRKR